MPKPKSYPTINLNLLKPQSNPEKIFNKLIKWLLSSGRYIFVFVEAVVLIAFGARFKLDAELQAKKEAVEDQIPYIESLKPYEILTRQTQLKLSSIDVIKKDSLKGAVVLKKIADQIPQSITITALNIEKKVGTANIHLIGQTKINRDIASLIAGLKEDGSFLNINLSNVGMEEGLIKFTIDSQVQIVSTGGKSL